MPADVYRSDRRPYFVTVCTYAGFPWFTVHPSLAQHLVSILRELAKSRGSRVYAWCVMPDHLHLVLEDADLVAFVGTFKGRATVEARRLQPGQKLWQRSFFDRGIRRPADLLKACWYTWENPLRAGLVERAQDWRGSGSLEWPTWWEAARETTAGVCLHASEGRG
jgi:REP element-mobilizing transposase RayT